LTPDSQAKPRLLCSLVHKFGKKGVGDFDAFVKELQAEPTHSTRFVALMDRLMPQWRACRDELNRLPVCHENWSY